MIEAKSIQRAVATLCEAGAKEVYVFGSAAHSMLRDDSDIDLAVSGLAPELFFSAMAKAEAALERPLDLVDLDRPTPFTKYLKEEGALVRVG